MFRETIIVCSYNPADTAKQLNFLSFPALFYFNSLSLLGWLYFHGKALFLALK
jgi:hypothetical protein